MKKFKTRGFRPSIQEIEVYKETEASVWFNGRRYSKRTSYDNYFDTWDEAFAFLIDEAAISVARYQDCFNEAQDRMRELERFATKRDTQK